MPSRSLALRFFVLAALALASTFASPAGAVRIVVDTLDDTDLADGDCSLREAIRAANQDAPYRGCAGGSDGDRIEFAVSGRIDLGSDLPAVREDLTLVGPGPSPGALVVDGGGQHRILLLDGPEEEMRLTVRNLTLRAGFHADYGGCVTARRTHSLEIESVRLVSCHSELSGGAIAGDGARSVRVVRSEIRDNVAEQGGGGIAIFGEDEIPARRGGLTTTFLIEDTTVSGGSAGQESAGGGVAVVLAQGAIRRSTLSGNVSNNAGGGLVVIAGDVVIEESTIVDNVADDDGDDDERAGGGIYLVGFDDTFPTTMGIRDTIVAGNSEDSGDDNDVTVAESAGVVSLGFNLVGVNAGATAHFPAGLPNVAGDWVGTESQRLDAELGPLDDEGGPTPTHLPLPGSLAIDRGICPGALRDQRGFGNPDTDRRPVDNPAVPDEEDGCDIGAVERGAVPLADLFFADGFESGGLEAWSDVVP